MRLAYLPIGLFVVLLGFLGYRLVLVQEGDAPSMIPSALIGKPAPAFALDPLKDGRPLLNSAEFKGRVALVNFFSSWCVPCRAEHPMLMDLGRNKGLVLIGIDYKDKREDALAWLARLGDPFAAIGTDPLGRVAIDYGVYGVPESYLIDREGQIRYKQVGPLTAADINGKILPLVAELNR